MDDRTDHFFCGTDRNIKKQGQYGISIFSTGCFRGHFNLWNESAFFITKRSFYYCAESADCFDMRISWNSGVFTAFLHSDFKYGIEISQK